MRPSRRSCTRTIWANLQTSANPSQSRVERLTLSWSIMLVQCTTPSLDGWRRTRILSSSVSSHCCPHPRSHLLLISSEILLNQVRWVTILSCRLNKLQTLNWLFYLCCGLALSHSRTVDKMALMCLIVHKPHIFLSTHIVDKAASGGKRKKGGGFQTISSAHKVSTSLSYACFTHWLYCHRYLPTNNEI